MVREVVTLNVGQAGIQLGQRIWKQYNGEHNINNDGKKLNTLDKDNSFNVFYSESSSGQYVPRNLSVDLEPNVIDDVKNSDISLLFDSQYLINGKEDAANNFARGYYTVGREIIDLVSNKIRKLVNNCDNIQGFIINHSVSGGTGSGLGGLISEKLIINYKNKARLNFPIYPSQNLSNCIVEPYNNLLISNLLIDNIDVSILLDNEAIYHLCNKNLNIIKPSYNNLNKLISKIISSMTASLRFSGELNVDIQEFNTNLVPFPRLHFMLTSMSPILSKDKKLTYNSNNIQEITDNCFNKNNFFISLYDFDVINDKYMAISLNYRGNCDSKETNQSIQWLKKNNKIKLVDWCPTGFKIGLNETPAVTLIDDDIASFNKNVTMIANNVAINRIFKKIILQKYDIMYSQKAFVHWFIGEGLEEGEFSEARENLAFLEKDYLDVLTEEYTDQYSEYNEEEDDDNDDNDDDSDNDDEDS